MFCKPRLMMGAAVAVLAAAAWQCAPASADQLGETHISSNLTPATEVRSITVSYGDLDLTTRGGVAALYHRIDVAAAYACGARYFTGSHAVSPYWVACKTRAAQDAVDSLDLQALSSYARGQATLAHNNGHETASRVKSG
jgi:UrcA family protein